MALRLYLSYKRWFFLVVSGLKTNTVRFWKPRTIRQFESVRNSGELVRVGGVSSRTCWGYVVILDVSSYRVSDTPLHILARDSVGIHGLFESVAEFLTQEFRSGVKQDSLRTVLNKQWTSLSFRFVSLSASCSQGRL
jgi:hypothetical protein